MVAHIDQKILDTMPSGLLNSESVIYSSSDNLFIQQIVDEALTVILGSNAGKPLCSLMSSDVNTFRSVTGASVVAASAIVAMCRKSAMQLPRLPTDRKYHFVVSPNPAAHLDSWTHPLIHGQTFLFIHERFHWQSLIQLITHEVYVSLDNLAALSAADHDPGDFTIVPSASVYN